MKRFTRIFTALLLTTTAAHAQHYDPAAFDVQHNIHTADGGMLTLVADKYLMELGETNLLTVRINWVNPGDETGVPQQYDYRFNDPSRAPWKITKWEILEGGGVLTVGPGKYYASYSAPAVMPPGKHATISVTLDAADPTKPKVQLLQTIYFADNDNVFYYNCPAYGIMQEKYVVKNNNSGLVSPSSTNTQQAMNAGSAAQKAQLEALQARLASVNQQAAQAGAAKNMDIALLTSNAKALYTKDKDFTAIEFKGTEVAMVNGMPSNKKRAYLISISFPGQKPGSYKIKSKDIIAVSIVMVSDRNACTCAFDPSKDPKDNPPCSGGTIVITKYDTQIGGYVEGYFTANLMGAVADHAIFGDLSGKFKVKLAKSQ